MYCQNKQYLMDIQSEPNITVYNKSGLLCKHKSRLTVFDDQLPVGRNVKMESF